MNKLFLFLILLPAVEECVFDPEDNGAYFLINKDFILKKGDFLIFDRMNSRPVYSRCVRISFSLKDGVGKDLEIEKSSGNRVLDRAFISYLEGFIFSPDADEGRYHMNFRYDGLAHGDGNIEEGCECFFEKNGVRAPF